MRIFTLQTIALSRYGAGLLCLCQTVILHVVLHGAIQVAAWILLNTADTLDLTLSLYVVMPVTQKSPISADGAWVEIHL